jgi:hypothetical protein
MVPTVGLGWSGWFAEEVLTLDDEHRQDKIVQ